MLLTRKRARRKVLEVRKAHVVRTAIGCGAYYCFTDGFIRGVDACIRQGVPVGVRGRGHSPRPALAVPQPDYNTVRVQKICPNKIGGAIVVYVLRDKGSTVCAAIIEVQNKRLAGAAQHYFDAAMRTPACERCLVHQTIGVKIRKR